MKKLLILFAALCFISLGNACSKDDVTNPGNDTVVDAGDDTGNDTGDDTGNDTGNDDGKEEENPQEELAVSIIGDSYSTFDGWSNKNNSYAIYYPALDVTTVDKTWWHMLVSKPGYRLEVNNSFSGSTVCNTYYGNTDVSGTEYAFITRVGKNKSGVDYMGDPDIILVLGGTNDAWAGSPMGEYIHSDWTYNDLKCFRPAFSKLLSSLKENYPDALIYNITNSGTTGHPGLSKKVSSSMAQICKYHKVPNIILEDISKSDGHPTYNGMKAICDQVYAVITGEKEPAPEPEDEVEETDPNLQGRRIDYGTPIPRYFLEYKTGEPISYNDVNWNITEFVPIPENVTKLTVRPITSYNGGSNGNQTCPVAFYDADKNYIREGSYEPNAKSEWAGNIDNFPIPENAEYVRFCWANYSYVHEETGEPVEMNGKINAVWPELDAE